MRADLRGIAEYIELWSRESTQIERHHGRRQQRGKLAARNTISTRCKMKPRLRRHVFEQRSQALSCLPRKYVFDRCSRPGETIGGQHQTSSGGVKRQGAAQAGHGVGDAEIARMLIKRLARPQ